MIKTSKVADYKTTFQHDHKLLSRVNQCQTACQTEMPAKSNYNGGIGPELSKQPFWNLFMQTQKELKNIFKRT